MRRFYVAGFKIVKGVVDTKRKRVSAIVIKINIQRRISNSIVHQEGILRIFFFELISVVSQAKRDRRKKSLRVRVINPKGCTEILPAVERIVCKTELIPAPVS